MALNEHGIAVGPDTPDKLRSFEQTTAAGVVQTEAVSVADPEVVGMVARVRDAVAADNEQGIVFREAGGIDSAEREYTHVPFSTASSGDTTLYTPASGKAVRLRWLHVTSNPADQTPPLVKFRFGATEIYRCFFLTKRQRKTGAVDAALIINISGGSSVVHGTAILEEV